MPAVPLALTGPQEAYWQDYDRLLPELYEAVETESQNEECNYAAVKQLLQSASNMVAFLDLRDETRKSRSSASIGGRKSADPSRREVPRHRVRDALSPFEPDLTLMRHAGAHGHGFARGGARLLRSADGAGGGHDEAHELCAQGAAGGSVRPARHLQRDGETRGTRSSSARERELRTRALTDTLRSLQELMASACTIHSAEFRKRFAPDAPADPEIPKGLEQLGDRCARTPRRAAPCRAVPRRAAPCRAAWL